MSIYLDPDTNDPFIDENGDLVNIEAERDVIVQYFRTWATTDAGTEITNLDWGFPRRDVLFAPYNQYFGYQNAVDMAMEKALSDFHGILGGIRVLGVKKVDRTLHARIEITGISGATNTVNVTIE